jgi:hypothetical protein
MPKVKLNSSLIQDFFNKDKNTWVKLGVITKNDDIISCCLSHALGELYSKYNPDFGSMKAMAKFIKPYLNADIRSSMINWECDDDEHNEDNREIINSL